MLVYALHSPGKQCLSPVRDLQQFKLRAQQLKSLSTGKLQAIPEELREFVKLLLNVTPEVRPDAHQFIKVFFGFKSYQLSGVSVIYFQFQKLSG